MFLTDFDGKACFGLKIQVFNISGDGFLKKNQRLGRRGLQARIQGVGAGAGAHPLDASLRPDGGKTAPKRGFSVPGPGVMKRHWCPSNSISTLSKYSITVNIFGELQIWVCVCQKPPIPIPYKSIHLWAPTRARNPGSAPGHYPKKTISRL